MSPPSARSGSGSAPRADPKLILASASPRRREILTLLGVGFEAVVPAVEELTEGEPTAVVLENARRKARAGRELAGPATTTVLGVDTDVALDGRLLGKPEDESGALERLRQLSGRTHDVLSGVVALGEAMEGGPVMLSWRDVSEAGESADWGYNVVVHEFAHVLDMGDGLADGIPPLSGPGERQRWQMVLSDEFDGFCARVDADEDTALDPYGAESPEEFFAVASEAFFVAPQDMRAEHPALYALLAGYYRQDPAA